MNPVQTIETGVAGVGWITPLGDGISSVLTRIRNGTQATLHPDPPVGATAAPASRRVPAELVASVARDPRLRRSSAISLFAVSAARNTLHDAGNPPVSGSDTGLVLAVSSGGVVYTRRFYEGVLDTGPGAGSPILFPETVYNAPASHVSAALGLDGPSYTLVGDASTGIAALHLAARMIASGEVGRCLVVGTEEADPITGIAYSRCRLRTVFGEGAAALLLDPAAPLRITVSEPVTWFRRTGAAAALTAAMAPLPSPTAAFTGTTETALGRIEADTVLAAWPRTHQFALKNFLGESLGAAAMIQAAAAAVTAREAGTPAAITSIGINLQAGAACLHPPHPVRALGAD